MLQIKRSQLKELARNKFGEDSIESQSQILIMISVASAARTSYTVVGEEKEINYQNMVELHDRLVAQDPPHSSPLEHCARAMSDEEYVSFVKGNIQTEKIRNLNCEVYGWCNNLKGFIPYRYIIENNYDRK